MSVLTDRNNYHPQNSLCYSSILKCLDVSQFTMDRYDVLVLLFLLFLLAPTTPPSFSLSESQQELLGDYEDFLRYETNQAAAQDVASPLAEVNLTNVRPHPGHGAVEFLPKSVSDAISGLWRRRTDNLTFYSNISSVTRGTFVRHAPVVKVNMTPVFSEAFDIKPAHVDLKNRGSVTLVLRESNETFDLSRSISGSVVLTNHQTIEMSGVYLKGGKVVLSSQSLKFSGVLAIPFMFPPEYRHQAEETRSVVLSWSRNLLKSMRTPTVESYSMLETLAEHASSCEFVLYGYVHPSGLKPAQLADVEKELEHPIGRPTPSAPSVQLSAILYSPDCGEYLTFDSHGMQSERLVVETRHMLMLLGLLMLTIAMVMSWQMEIAHSPSAMNRISFWSIAGMALVDGWMCISVLVMSMGSGFKLHLLGVALISFVLTCFVDLYLMSVIFSCQLSQSVGATVAQAPQTPAALNEQEGTAADPQRINANAVAATSPEVPPREPPTEREVASMIYTRYYCTLLLAFVISLATLNWNDGLRSVIESIVSLFLYSYWVPQIWHSARLGLQCSLKPQFIITISLLRLLPLMYLCFVPSNVGGHHQDSQLGYSLLALQWTQILVLLAQHYLGARFFIPGAFVSPLYDYHRVLVLDEEEGAVTEEPPSVSSTHGEITARGLTPNSEGTVQVSCAICMSPVNVAVAYRGEPFPQAPRDCMVTPCRHVFHSQCLRQWMESRLQCPICRASLPPV